MGQFERQERVYSGCNNTDRYRLYRRSYQSYSGSIRHQTGNGYILEAKGGVRHESDDAYVTEEPPGTRSSVKAPNPTAATLGAAMLQFGADTTHVTFALGPGFVQFEDKWYFLPGGWTRFRLGEHYSIYTEILNAVDPRAAGYAAAGIGIGNQQVQFDALARFDAQPNAKDLFSLGLRFDLDTFLGEHFLIGATGSVIPGSSAYDQVMAGTHIGVRF